MVIVKKKEPGQAEIGMNDTFISYASTQYDEARVLGEYLQNDCGMRVWMDKAKIMGHEGWRAVITKAIENSRTLTLIVSKYSVQSEDVETEIIIASDAKIPILFVYLENAELSPTMKYIAAGKQSLRFIDKEKIKEVLSSALNTTSSVSAVSKPSSFPLSVGEQIDIMKIKPNFILGNGKNSNYVGQWNAENDGWHLLLFNKGKEARNFSVKVLPEHRKNVHCKFLTDSVKDRQELKVFVRRLSKEIDQESAMRSLEIRYEDTDGISYSQRVDEMIDRVKEK